MNVNFSDDQMNTIVAKAVLDSLTPERRDELIQSAVKGLLEKDPEPRGYGDKRSAFQRAFDSAVRQVAEKVAYEQLRDNEEVKASIAKMFADAWAKLSAGDAYDGLVSKIASAMAEGLTGSKC